jgi:hypothetical protein
MKKALLVTAALGICLLAVLLLVRPAQMKGQDMIVSGSDKDLSYQISKLDADVKRLEAQIADLRKQLKQLESNPRVVTLPGSQFQPGFQLPPGSKSHEINGIKFWTIPVQ